MQWSTQKYNGLVRRCYKEALELYQNPKIKNPNFKCWQKIVGKLARETMAKSEGLCEFLRKKGVHKGDEFNMFATNVQFDKTLWE